MNKLKLLQDTLHQQKSLCFIAASLCTPMLGADTLWMGSNDLNWENPKNWDGGALPNGSDDTIIRSQTTVRISKPVTPLTLRPRTRLEVIYPGSGFRVQKGGELATDQIWIKGGADCAELAGGRLVVQNRIYIGMDNHDLNRFVVSDGTLELKSALLIGSLTKSGEPARGTLIVSGGKVIPSGDSESLNLSMGRGTPLSKGTINLTGGSITLKSSERRIRIGEDGSGIINQSGGSLNLNGPVYLGFESTGSGLINFSGGILFIDSLIAGNGAAHFHITGNAPDSRIEMSNMALQSPNSVFKVTIDPRRGITPISVNDAGEKDVLFGGKLMISAFPAFTANHVGKSWDLIATKRSIIVNDFIVESGSLVFDVKVVQETSGNVLRATLLSL